MPKRRSLPFKSYKKKFKKSSRPHPKNMRGKPLRGGIRL